ncbi:MAG TPA: alkaline phosphatase PhoX, partial [Steroidobacteraceae bacterium]|nr:alkaline phosphatase PhoX [Steroidobacteraceae bacterium]
MSHDHAEDNNSTFNPSLETVVAARLSRRDMLSGAGSAAALAVFGGAVSTQAAAQGGGYGQGYGYGHSRNLKLGFSPVAKSIEDVVSVPKGYSVDILFALGDPMAKHVGDYSNDGTDDAASFEFRAGDHHDGMYFFGLGHNGRYNKYVSDRGLLCQNHEAITPGYLHPTGQTIVNGVRTVADEVLREFYLHGVSIIEVVREKSRRHDKSSGPFRKRRHPVKRAIDWDYEQHSRFNRRIHTLTDMKMSGPAARTPYLITKYSPDGSRTRGTVNNCANGYTPWGTFLTCEENFAGYFRRVAA